MWETKLNDLSAVVTRSSKQLVDPENSLTVVMMTSSSGVREVRKERNVYHSNVGSKSEELLFQNTL